MVGGLSLFARSSTTHPVFSTFEFDWSFWLCVVHVCLLIVCAVIIALDRDHHAARRWITRSSRHHGKGVPHEKLHPKNPSPIYKKSPTSLDGNKKMKLKPDNGGNEKTGVKVQFQVAITVSGADESDAGRRTSTIRDFTLSNELLKPPELCKKQLFSSLEGIPHLLRSQYQYEDAENCDCAKGDAGVV
jgi:hypothetical protein